MEQKKFDKRDFDYIATFIADTYASRKRRRLDYDKQVKEVDRQLSMTPDVGHKLDSQGRIDDRKKWMPEIELPLQAQALEVLTADARRMMSPDSGPWFDAHAAADDKYLEYMDTQTIITGDEMDVPSIMNQENIDNLVRGTIGHWHRQYNFWDHVDQMNAEAFKYGVMIGRGRMVKKSVLFHANKGNLTKDQEIPVLFPRSIKNIYLDENEFNLMNAGYILGPSVICADTMHIEDMKLAVKHGGTDPHDMNGGWVQKNMAGLDGDEKGFIQTLEYEGDLTVPRQNIRIRNAIVTVVQGKSNKESVNRVVRVRFAKQSTYVIHKYHSEQIDSPYGTSPLLKGLPIQKMASDMANRILIAAAIHNEPPISWDPDDLNLAASGGPRMEPGAAWETTGNIKVHPVGDPGIMMNMYQSMIQQHADVTGVNQPRLGAQTRSHTTAFAKEAELSRGTIRTVDYVKAALRGPMTKWLEMCYRMGRNNMTKTETIYIDAYKGFVDINKTHLPEKVVFNAQGAGGPQEEQAKEQKKLGAIQQAMGLEQLKVQQVQAMQLGVQPTIDLDKAIREVLGDGGWSDIDAITHGEETDVAEPPPLDPNAQQQIAPGTALETISGQ